MDSIDLSSASTKKLLNELSTKELLARVVVNTRDAPYNFNVSLLDVVNASLGFVMSLALNEALSLSFQRLAYPTDPDVEDPDLLAAWLYALAMLVGVLVTLFLLNGCIKPILDAKINITCQGYKRWLVPLIGVILVGIILAIPSMIRKVQRGKN